jgi:hypothetical protein
MRTTDDVATDGQAPATPQPDPTPAWVGWVAARLSGTARRLRDDRLCWALLAAAVAVYSVVALYLTRGTTMFVDEVNVLLVDRGFHPSALLTPLNGHLVLLERLIYTVDFKLFGAEWVPIRLAQAVGASAAVALAFEFARRRIGGAAALAPAVLLLFLGSAWELTFVVSGIGNVYAVAAALGAFLALERRDARGDLVACVLLVVAVTSFTIGAAFVAGALLLLALQPRFRARAWVALVPAGIYLAWLAWVRLHYLPDHPGTQVLHIGNLLLVPNFFADEAASLAGAVAGLDYPFEPDSFFVIFSTQSVWGAVIAALAVAAIVLRVRRAGSSALLWAAIATLLVFWVELALGFGEGRNPGVVRYAYGGAVVSLLIGAEAFRRARASDRALLVVYLLVGCALLTNVARLRDGMRYFRSSAITLRADLGAIELARDRVAPGYVNTGSRLQPVFAGPYLAAVDRIGSPAFTESELARQGEDIRRSADGVLITAERISVAPRAGGRRLGTCTRVTKPGPSVSFPVGPPGVALTSSNAAQVALRRFASATSTPVGRVAAGRQVSLPIPIDRSKRPWVLTLTPGPASLSVCPLR